MNYLLSNDVIDNLILDLAI